MFKWLDELSGPVKCKDDKGPQIEINIKAPKDKVSSCLSYVHKTMWSYKPEKGKFLCINVRGDHFLIEVSNHDIYVEYLTTSVYKNMKKIWNKGVIS